MSKTNFDDIDLTTPGIEADEVNSEAATVGQVLTADGAGAAAFETLAVVVAEIDSEAATVGQVLTADGAGAAAWDDPAGPGYLEYVALLSQSGTNAPVATVLKNTLGGTVVWVRDGVGLYSGNLIGAFPSGKTQITPESNWDFSNLTASQIYVQTDLISVATYDMSSFPTSMPATDNAFLPGIKVRVYP